MVPEVCPRGGPPRDGHTQGWRGGTAAAHPLAVGRGRSRGAPALCTPAEEPPAPGLYVGISGKQISLRKRLLEFVSGLCSPAVRPSSFSEVSRTLGLAKGRGWPGGSGPQRPPVPTRACPATRREPCLQRQVLACQLLRTRLVCLRRQLSPLRRWHTEPVIPHPIVR